MFLILNKITQVLKLYLPLNTVQNTGSVHKSSSLSHPLWEEAVFVNYSKHGMLEHETNFKIQVHHLSENKNMAFILLHNMWAN